MASTMTVEVVSPENVLFSGEATMVITRTLGGGEVAFQAGHAPFLAALVPNHTRVFLSDGNVEDIAGLGDAPRQLGVLQPAHPVARPAPPRRDRRRGRSPRESAAETGTEGASRP